MQIGGADSMTMIWVGGGMGDFLLRALIVAVAAYFLGCFNGAVIVSKYILRDDIRTHGSGNAGLTNFFRTFGGPLTFVVILTDVLKAVIAVLVGVWIANGFAPSFWNGELAIYGKYWAGLFCLVGHMFPCMFGFKGGKGILSGGTVAWMIDWRLAVVAWGAFLLLAVLTKWVSLGSIAAGTLFPIMSFVLYRDVIVTVLGLIIGVLIVWKHRENLGRILKGTESKFTFHRKKEEGSGS